VCSNKIVLGFYLVEFIDSAVLVIEFMVPPTIQKVKDGVGIYLLCSILFYSILFYSILFYSILFYSILFYSILIVVPWYSSCKILIGKLTVRPCFL
jgi:hypothetical protein